MPRIGFLYPQDPQQAFAAAAVGRGARSDTPLPDTAIDRLDFNYRMSGDRDLQPVRVFNDGTHTYLQMPQVMREVPVLFAIGSDGGDTLVNYRFTGLYYVVDGVPTGIALVEGSGKHQRRALVTRGS
jgi:type IV secretion system protein VirB9